MGAPHQYYVVNGILSRPSHHNGWTDKAERWYQQRDIICTRYEYFCGVIRSLGRAKRAREIAEEINDITRPVVYVGHSNGCDLFCYMMREHDVEVKAAHLIAGATECDFEKNGLNDALEDGRIDTVYVYGSASDTVLQRGHRLTGWLSRFDLGYGNPLGLFGPQNVRNGLQHRVKRIWKTMNHSEWFNADNFDDTFNETLKA